MRSVRCQGSACFAGPGVARQIRLRRVFRCAEAEPAGQVARLSSLMAFRSTTLSGDGSTGVACRVCPSRVSRSYVEAHRISMVGRLLEASLTYSRARLAPPCLSLNRLTEIKGPAMRHSLFRERRDIGALALPPSPSARSEE